MRTDTPRTIYLKDYRRPPYTVRHAELRIEIHDERTLVHSTLQMAQEHEGEEPLFLNGEHLMLKQVELDGVEPDHVLDEKGLTIPCPGKKDFTLTLTTEIYPDSNTALEGLYRSGGTYCTQCEAEGFRRITFFPDRPDVMSTFRVRIEAGHKHCPVLLSNGNLIEEGPLENGRHYAVWDDPTPKPCYLFALVAGELEHIRDSFTTCSGRAVDLRIYVRKGDEGQCAHAMSSLKKSMRWDEEKYGREYQYERFNIVAVSDFNMGAMENTSLNIFNTALVLAHPDTATDNDFIRVESVIAHEYFHNWTGNRVTCRDWFQLSLKEGLTVFRDQEFSADMNSRDVQRIDDVTHLRRLQFPEDAGPLAHPVRPDNYIEINNFYTMTVYEKGAEIIRMFYNLLGPATYRKATDLYFERHDGQAVTCEDWAQCMEDASGLDLSQFKLWYEQAGTPEITAHGAYDAAAGRYTLTLEQQLPSTPGQPDKKPMHIPVALGLLGPNGKDILPTQMLELTEDKQSFTFEDLGTQPVPSVLRGFSAPVKLITDLSDDDLRFLMVHDSDGFNRWEAGQTYMLRAINSLIAAETVAEAENLAAGPVLKDFLQTYGALLDRAVDPQADRALAARSLSLPDIQTIALAQDIVDPDVIYKVREGILNAIVDAHTQKLEDIICENSQDKDVRAGAAFDLSPEAMGRRALKNTALLIRSNQRTAADSLRCKTVYDSAGDMTGRLAAFYGLCAMETTEREAAVVDFHQRFHAYPLVVDKWFSGQAIAVIDDIMARLHDLKAHDDFTFRNPNRVRALFGAFAMNNPVCFHRRDGAGYDFLTEAVIELNDINPQIAARLLTPMREWRRYTQDRQTMMKQALEEITNLPNLSPDVFEIASKSLSS